MKEEKEWERRPSNVLAELCRTCRTYLPDQRSMSKPLTHPTAACKLAILCEEETPEDQAILQIQVFCIAKCGLPQNASDVTPCASYHAVAIMDGLSLHPTCYRAEHTYLLHLFLSGHGCDQVFVYKMHGSCNGSFFQSIDSWLPVDMKNRRHSDAPTSCLKDVMEYFLLGDPVVKVRFLSRSRVFKTLVGADRCARRAK